MRGLQVTELLEHALEIAELRNDDGRTEEFVNSVWRYYEANGEITDKQVRALEDIR